MATRVQRVQLLFLLSPRLRGGKGTGVVRSRQATENPVTRFPLGKGGAVRHQSGRPIGPAGCVKGLRKRVQRVQRVVVALFGRII